MVAWLAEYCMYVCLACEESYTWEGLHRGMHVCVNLLGIIERMCADLHLHGIQFTSTAMCTLLECLTGE